MDLFSLVRNTIGSQAQLHKNVMSPVCHEFHDFETPIKCGYWACSYVSGLFINCDLFGMPALIFLHTGRFV